LSRLVYMLILAMIITFTIVEAFSLSRLDKEQTLLNLKLASVNTSEVQVKITPPGCVDVHVFRVSTGSYGFTLVPPANACIEIKGVIIDNHSIPQVSPGCRSRVQVNPIFQPYMALGPGSRVKVELVVVSETARRECTVVIKVNMPQQQAGYSGSTTTPGTPSRGSPLGVYEWLRGTPVRTPQYHRLKMLASSRSVAMLVGLAWLVVVVGRLCMT